jgi:EmrB/QacA subfamily drug resistance transporter
MKELFSKTQNNDLYSIQIACLFACVWFIDLLDSTILNVALPSIASSFRIDPTQAEWAILGFLLTLSASMSISQWISEKYGVRKIFLLSQFVYLISSFLCGTAATLSQLVFFRLVQGFAGGILMPLGMSLLMNTVPQRKWAVFSSRVNMVSLLAPALGPIIAGYVTAMMGWPWLFYLKLPLSALCLFLSFLWVRPDQPISRKNFDWAGFALGTMGITLILFSLSKMGQPGVSNFLSIGLFVFSLLLIAAFVQVEDRIKYPLIPMGIFRIRLYSIGNLIQCSANVIFLGSIFIIGLFLQEGLKYSIVMTGWILSPITIGMFVVLPLVAKFYNRLGPLPFIIPGLALLSCCMFAFCLISPSTHPLWIAAIIFVTGAASSVVQTPNVLSIFSEITNEERTAASAVYALLKQISASIGVALSTMVITIGLVSRQIPSLSSAPTFAILPLFKIAFIVLGSAPLLALFLCFYIDNKKAIEHATKH